ncbi:hypothetical protein [Rhodoligotrophos defluvii]|uniref:hypothetical protein n=1 Tax=Rhodoligotrophos defluvii TaxID=2561934 RepID=UPI0010C96EA8|nr:hypothetical protein [Rhodoligotrophos defluvii]
MRLLERASPVVLAGVLGALVAMSVGLGGLFLLRGAETESAAMVAQTTQAGAEAVGRAVAGELNRALGYGIPLNRLNRVQPYLRRIVEGSPQVEAIAIRDATGKVLYSTANHVEGLTFPLQVGAQPVGSVALEPAPPLNGWLVSRLEAALAAAALLCGLLAGLALYLFSAYYLRAAEQRFGQSLLAIQNGRFPTGGLDTAGRGVAVEAFRALDRALEPIRAASRRLDDAAATVRGIDFDGSLGDKVDRLLAGAGHQRLVSSKDEPAAGGRASSARLWPAAAVVGVYCAAAPLLANYAIDREWSLVSRAWWPTVPIIVEVLGVMAAAVAAARLPGALRMPAGLLGLLIAALATGTIAFSRSYPAFAGLRLGAGLGLGLLLGSIFAGRNRRERPGSSWLLILLAGTCLGPLLGGLLAEAVGRRMAFLLIGAGLGISLLLIPRLVKAGVAAAASPRGDRGSVATILVALGMVLGAASLVWIPVEPGYDSYLVGGGLIAGVGLASTVLAYLALPAVSPAAAWALPLGLVAGSSLLSTAGLHGMRPLGIVLAVAAGLLLVGLVLTLRSGRPHAPQADQAG